MVKTEKMTKFLIAEKKNRKFLLEGNLWKVILYFTLPIMIYWVFQNIADAIDLLILKRSTLFNDAKIPIVNRIHLFKGILIPFGIAIATGGVILVGRAYGQNDVDKMQLYLAKTFVLSILMGLSLAFLCIFAFQSPILEYVIGIKGDSSEQLEQKTYYNLIMLSLVCVIINTVFLGLERAKGNNKIALFLNLFNAFIKIILSYVLFQEWSFIAILAWSTLISNGIITLYALWCLFFDRQNPFQIILKKLRFDKEFLRKLLKLAIPVCASISVYGLGKLVVSIIVRELYGSESILIGTNLALAVAINNIFYNMLNSFSDSQNAIISQNLGHNNLNRALEAFRKIIFCMCILALLGTLINCFGYKLILSFFNDSNWEKILPKSQKVFRRLLFFETTSLWLSCGSIILFNFLLSFKRTATSVYMNLLRTLSRIFFVIIFSEKGIPFGEKDIGVGLSIFLSNLICFICTFVVFLSFYLKLKREKTFERE